MPQPQPDQPGAPDGPGAGEPDTPVPGSAPTKPVPAPRWSGSAPVPPPGPPKRRWLDSALIDGPAAPAPPRRDPTLEQPSAELAEFVDPLPVDPWADTADSWMDASPYPTPVTQPPTLPYPTGPPPSHHTSPPPSHYTVPPAAWQPTGPGVRPLALPPGQRQPGPEHRPPPGWQPPRGYVAVPVRRRHRWPWIMLVLTLSCCCGVPGYAGNPIWQQYPAKAAPPDEVADLRLVANPASEQAARQLRRELRAEHWLAEDTFAGIYATPSGKRVTVFGTTGFRLSPDKDVKAEITRLTDTYLLTDVRTFDTGNRGEYRQCGTGRAEDSAVVLCAWADHGSLGVAVFTKLSVENSAELLGELRAQIVTRG